MSKPLMIDLFAGLGGWADGGLAEGFDVIGFDIERHEYGAHRYPAQLVVQDVLSLDGAQLRDAALIVASPPCQEYSYMAMPWKRGKRIAAALRGEGDFPDDHKGSRTLAELNALFDACFRLQREACAAAGRHIPLVVENVRGAQPWVGRARWNFGSYFLWGDVPALMPPVFRGERKSKAGSWDPARANDNPDHDWDGQKHNPDGTNHGQGSWFAVADSKERGSAHTRHLTAPAEHGVKQGGAGRAWFDKELESDNLRRMQCEGAVGASMLGREPVRMHGMSGDGIKVPSQGGRRTDRGKGARFTSTDCGVEGVKQRGSGRASFDKALDERRKNPDGVKNGGDWFGSGRDQSFQRRFSGTSGRKNPGIELGDIGFNVASAHRFAHLVEGVKVERTAEDKRQHIGTKRKFASAMIAKIPEPLARHVAATFARDAVIDAGDGP